jgi:hypothetical protein
VLPALAAAGALLLLLASPGRSAAEGLAPFPLGKAASGPAELALSFEAAAVIASGLTPEGDALLFSIAREPERYFVRVARRDEVLAVDGEGRARYEPFADGAPLPLAAVWVVVDLATGRAAHGTTPGFSAPAGPLPADGVRRGSGGRWNRLAARLNEAQVLLVRPAEAPPGPPEGDAEPGAWGAYWMDGSGRDLDGADDGALETALDALVPVIAGGPPPPEELSPGDLLVLVDPTSLAYYIVRLTPGDLERSTP